MQVLCGLQVLFLLFNCQTPVINRKPSGTARKEAVPEGLKFPLDISDNLRYSK